MVFVSILARSQVTPRGMYVGRGASRQVLFRVLRFSPVTAIVVHFVRFIRLPPRYIIEESSTSSNKTRDKKN